jgi:hypothetical protein
MRTAAIVVLALGLSGPWCPSVLSQAKPIQQAGSCSINTNGNNNTASLVCNEVDPKLAEQVQAIVNGTLHNEKATKEIISKLDLILKELAGAPPRRIPPDKRAQIISTLARWPAKVQVLAVINSAEAYDFALDWYDVFKAAGWTMTDDVVRSFITTSRPEPGITIKMHGESVAAGQSVTLKPESPEGAVAISLGELGMTSQTKAQRTLDTPDGELFFEVNAEPRD